MSELQKKLDEAAKELAKLDEDKFGQWLAYFLEAIEAESGVEGLNRVDEILLARFTKGRW
jgi:translation initiation factor 2 alpha subunit (eIF-2alpha)